MSEPGAPPAAPPDGGLSSVAASAPNPAEPAPGPPGGPVRPVSSPRAHWLLFVALSLAIIAVDQLAKAWVAGSYQLGVPVQVFGDAVRITVSHNQGALFGLVQGTAVVLGVFSLVVVGLIVWYEAHAGQSVLVSIALGLLMGGAIGNLVDRLRQGFVVDFVDIGVGAVRWFTFNLSDVSIDGAILLLILLTIFPPRTDRPVASERPA